MPSGAEYLKQCRCSQEALSEVHCHKHLNSVFVTAVSVISSQGDVQSCINGAVTKLGFQLPACLPLPQPPDSQSNTAGMTLSIWERADFPDNALLQRTNGLLTNPTKKSP